MRVYPVWALAAQDGISLGELSLAVLAIVAVVVGAVALNHYRKIRKNTQETCKAYAKRFFSPTPLETLVTVSRVFPQRMRVDLQKALRAALAQYTEHSYLGVRAMYSHEGLSLGAIFTESHFPIYITNLEHEEVDIGEDQPVRCVTQALWLLEHSGIRFVVLLAAETKFGQSHGIRVEIGHPTEAAAEKLATELFKSLENGVANAGSYRGKVLSLAAR